MERYEEWMSDSGKWKENIPPKAKFEFLVYAKEEWRV